MIYAVIDGDLVAYRCSAVNENATNAGLVHWQVDQMISRILEDVNANNWTIYISGENNFRNTIYSEYKANRRNVPRPRYLEAAREYLVLGHGAHVTDGYEADDALGIYACTSGDPSNVVICSLDKDLLQIPGRHYNFVKRTSCTISRFDGLRNFYEQLLVGDPTDNIRGCPGIGKAKAPKLLEGCDDEECLCECAWNAYAKAGVSEEEFIRSARLLYILKSEDDSFRPPLDLELL